MGDSSTGESRRRLEPTTPLQRKIQRRTDVAVLASNFPSRLAEIEDHDAVTHRSSKRWKAAKLGVEAHNRLPVYYRSDGEITHTGYISELLLDPKENDDRAEAFLDRITDDDTYGDFNDMLDTTTYLVTGGTRLDEPFPQTALRKLSDGEPVDENFSRHPAYVIQRPEDFPEFP